MNVKLKKRTMTAVAIACLTAFAANAQAAPRAVTIPKNAKSTVATAAAKIIKNNLKKGKAAKADDECSPLHHSSRDASNQRGESRQVSNIKIRQR